MDAAEARRHMVDGQLRPNQVDDPRIVAAMRELPRHRFAPAAQAARVHADADVPLPGGRFMLKPLVIARLVQLAGCGAASGRSSSVAGTATARR